MDYPSQGSVRQPNTRSMKKKQQPMQSHSHPQSALPNSPPMYSQYGQPVHSNPQLFHDTSAQDMYGHGNVYPALNISHQQIFSDPAVASVAMNYGQALVGHGKDIVDKNIEKYISVSKLKYYFAVDTTYVTRKIALLLFPYSHADWSIKYNQDEPVAPRYEINAPDLYIPVMAFVTYVLLTGYLYGLQNRFTPEQLGIQASSALVWLILEVLAILTTIYITRLESQVKVLDLIAFCGYKYVGMVASLLGSLIFKQFAYYVVLLYASCSIGFFLVRTMRLQLVSGSNQSYDGGSKRRLYLLLFVALVQPVMMYWLTYHVIAPPLELSSTR